MCVRSVPTNQQVRCVFSLAAATAFYSRPCRFSLNLRNLRHRRNSEGVGGAEGFGASGDAAQQTTRQVSS